jgi:hypothetical protein
MFISRCRETDISPTVLHIAGKNDTSDKSIPGKDTGNNFIAGNYDTVINMSPVSFTLEINTKLKISPHIFLQKFEMVPIEYLLVGN